MRKSTWLRTTALDDVYEECVENTDAAMARKPGKKTLGLDGKTDIKGRGVCNLTASKVGRTSYIKSVWFGRKKHDAEHHARIAKVELGDGKAWAACLLYTSPSPRD